MGKTVKQIKGEVANLSYANIDSESREMDWREELGEDLEGWRSYELVECSCGKKMVITELGECQHCEIDDESRCKGWVNSGGPMMNYFYPAEFRMSCEEAAELCEGCCIVIELEDGTTGFALAGGGMDLSWDIAGSYVACGLLPPAWIRLPRFGGATLTPYKRRIIEACRESAEAVAQRARAGVRDLDDLVKWMRGNTKKAQQRKKEKTDAKAQG